MEFIELFFCSSFCVGWQCHALHFLVLNGPPNMVMKIRGCKRQPNVYRLLLPSRIISALVFTVFISAIEQILPSPPHPHCYLSSNTGLIPMVPPIGPPRFASPHLRQFLWRGCIVPSCIPRWRPPTLHPPFASKPPPWWLQQHECVGSTLWAKWSHGNL